MQNSKEVNFMNIDKCPDIYQVEDQLQLLKPQLYFLSTALDSNIQFDQASKEGLSLILSDLFDKIHNITDSIR